MNRGMGEFQGSEVGEGEGKGGGKAYQGRGQGWRRVGLVEFSFTRYRASSYKALRPNTVALFYSNLWVAAKLSSPIAVLLPLLGRRG